MRIILAFLFSFALSASGAVGTNIYNLVMSNGVPISTISNAQFHVKVGTADYFLTKPTNAPAAGNLVTWDGSQPVWAGAGTNAVGTVTGITFDEPLTGGTITNTGNAGIRTATTTNAGAVSTNLFALWTGKQDSLGTNAATNVLKGDLTWGPQSYTNLSDVPTSFNPNAHTQAMYTITGLETALTNKQTNLNLTSTDVLHLSVAYDFATLSPASTILASNILYWNTNLTLGSNYVAKGRGTNGLIESSIWDNGTYTGFGTPSPYTRIHAYATAPTILVQASDADASNPQFELLDTSGNGWALAQGNVSDDSFYIGNFRGGVWNGESISIGTNRIVNFPASATQAGYGIWDYRFTSGTLATNWAAGNHNHDSAYAGIIHTQDWATITNLPVGWFGPAPPRMFLGTHQDLGYTNTVTLRPIYSTDIPSLDASKITSGTFDIGRLPTGTASTNVALGNHTHSGYEGNLGAPPVSGRILSSTSGGTRSWVEANAHNHDATNITTGVFTDTQMNASDWGTDSGTIARRYGTGLSATAFISPSDLTLESGTGDIYFTRGLPMAATLGTFDEAGNFVASGTIKPTVNFKSSDGTDGATRTITNCYGITQQKDSNGFVTNVIANIELITVKNGLIATP